MTITALIIDDELHCSTALLHDLNMFCPQIQVLACCHSGEEGLKAIEEYRPHIIFLDIEMPNMNGFELLELLHERSGIQVIFVTAYDQYILQALRINALDYLLKPVDSSDLIHAVQRAEVQLASKDMHDGRLLNLITQLKTPTSHQRIALAGRNGYEFVPPDEICYCKADGAYTQIILKDNREIFLSKALGEVEQLLPTQLFIRIHHSSIVNTQLIKQINKNEGYHVVMSNGDTLSIARSKKDALLLRMGII